MVADIKLKVNHQNGLINRTANNNTDRMKILKDQYQPSSIVSDVLPSSRVLISPSAPPTSQYHQLPLVKNYPEVTFCNLSDNSSSIDALSSTATTNTKLINNNTLSPTSTITPTKGTTTYFGGANDNQNHHNNNSNNNSNDNKKRKRLISDGSADSITSSTATTEKKKPDIPDGGFGWVVVFASLMVSLIADGVSFSFGLIYTELNMYFQESKTKTAWVSSLFLAIPLLVGPIMSNLVDKYGCRRMTLVGGLISSSGFALGSLCNSIEMLYLTFGVISGLGLGIGYVTAVVSIAFWFDKKRTFATGIGASGTGIGTFLYAPFTQYLIEEYGWRGATLLLAGTMLNTCVFGALMRDPDWLIEENRLESRSQSVTTFSNSSVCLDEIKKLLETGAPKEAVLDTLVTNCNTEANTQIPDPYDPRAVKRYRSEIFLPTYLCSQDLLSIDEIKRESRRSLRHKNEHDTISRENLLSLSSGGGAGAGGATMSDDEDANKNHSTTEMKNNLKKKYLASIETLSPSEKMTTVPNTPLRSSFGGSLQSANDNLLLEHDFINNEQRFNGSRFSLNENLISKTNNDSVIDIRNKFRGNSLDILRDGIHGDHENELTTKLLNHQDDQHHHHHHHHNHHHLLHHNGIVIQIPEETAITTTANNVKLRPTSESIKKKQRSSLKRNISIKHANYLQNVRIHRNSIHYRGAMLNTHRYRLRASSCPNIFRNSMTTIAKEDEDTWYDNFMDIIKSMFDFSLFLDIKFTILNLSTLLLFTWYIVPYLYITEHMLKHNYTEEDSAVVLSTIGIFSTIGMVGLGFVGDRPWLNVNISYAICMLFCGISLIIMPLVIDNFWLLVSMNALFGITFASTFSFTPSIIVNLVDLDDFTIAYGLVLLVQGVGSLIGPPLAGLTFELTDIWDYAFYAGGVFISISGVLAYIIDILEKREENLKKLKKGGSDTGS